MATIDAGGIISSILEGVDTHILVIDALPDNDDEIKLPSRMKIEIRDPKIFGKFKAGEVIVVSITNDVENVDG